MSPLHRSVRSHGLYRIPIGPAKLYLDDIQDIVSNLEVFALALQKEPDSQVITGVAEGASAPNLDENLVRIVAGSASADVVEDLRDATNDELKRLTISLDSQRVSIDLWEIFADISISREDLQARALADDIAGFIRGKRPYRFYLPRKSTLLLTFPLYAMAILTISLAIYFDTIKKNGLPGFIIGGFAFVAAVMFTAQAFRYAVSRGSIRIVPMRRNESRGLSSRARRDIGIAIVASVVGAAIIGLAGLWAGLFAK